MSDFGDVNGMQNPLFNIMVPQNINNSNNVINNQNLVPQQMVNSNNMMNLQIMGNNITEQEIQKHKNNLNNLINKLINIHDVDEEISTNNEIKASSEFLFSLLNIKKKEINQLNDNNNIMNNSNNFPNPVLNQNNMNNINNNNSNDNQIQHQIMQQQMMQQQLMQQQMSQQQMMQQQMMAQQSQIQQQSLHNNINNDNFKGFTVIFRSGDSSNFGPMMLQCFPGDKVSSIIEKYRLFSGIDIQKKKFIFNGNPLSPNLTTAEAGLKKDSNIFVVSTEGIKD